MVKLKLVEGNDTDEAATTENGTAPAGDVNHGTKVLKELLEPWAGKGWSASVQPEK